MGLNFRLDEKEGLDQSGLDVVVDKYRTGEERVVVLAQRVRKFAVAELVVGYMVIGTESGNRWFWMNPSADHFDKSNRKLPCLVSPESENQTYARACSVLIEWCEDESKS